MIYLFPSSVARGRSPRATHEGNKSHNHELKADKWLIFSLARIPQGIQKYTEEKFLYCSSFFCYSTLHAGTSGIHKFLGLLKDHFTVVGKVTWPLTGSEAGVDLVLIQTSLLLLCKSSCSHAN